MPTMHVRVTETVVYEVTVEAPDAEAAEEMAEERITENGERGRLTERVAQVVKRG